MTYREYANRKKAQRKENTKTILCGLAFLVIFLGAMLLGGWCDTTYTMDATVSTHNGTQCFVDTQGEAWNDDRAQDYKQGDAVVITYNNKDTHTRYDDVIIRVKKK